MKGIPLLIELEVHARLLASMLLMLSHYHPLAHDLWHQTELLIHTSALLDHFEHFHVLCG